MSIAKITLIGMYNWDTTLFDDLEFPKSELLDKETAINRILLECGEFEVLYSDWNFLKFAITEWGKKWFYTFQKWVEALEVEYEPLENYNRVEHWEDNSERESEVKSTSDTKLRHRTYDNDEMTETDNTSGASNGTGKDKANIIRDGYARGNVGVTTSQQMLQSSLELYRGFNLYEQIANIFKTELVLAVYE